MQPPIVLPLALLIVPSLPDSVERPFGVQGGVEPDEESLRLAKDSSTIVQSAAFALLSDHGYCERL